MDASAAASYSSSSANSAVNSSSQNKNQDGSDSVSFMDAIFAHLKAQKSQDQANAASQAALKSQTAASDDSEDDLMQKLTLSGSTMTVADLEKMMQQAEAELKAEGKADPLSDAQTAGKDGVAQGDLSLALLSPQGKQQLLAVLQNLLKGTPAAQQPTVETLENGVLKKLDNTDLTSDKTATDTDATLLVSGLTPQQLAAIVKKLEDGDKDNTTAASAAGSLLVGVVQISPASLKKEDAFQPRSSLLSAQGVTGSGQPTANSIAAAAAKGANSGDAEGEDKDGNLESSSATPLTSGIDGKFSAKSTGGFANVLKMFETAKQQDTGLHLSTGDTPKTTDKISTAAALNSALPATDQTVAGDITATVDPSSIYPEGTTIAATQTAALQTATPLTATATMTSLVTASPQAIYAHPATQQVASALVKSSTSGPSTALSIMLDPPELGKIAVKMQFNNVDKTVKAVISADKPETYMMLSRDSHVLHQSLKDAGLDTGANGLTFQLSQDGSGMSGQNNQSNQGNNSKSQSHSSDDDGMTIETTMDWSADPTTGTMRYNVLA